MEQLDLFHLPSQPERLTVSEGFDVLWNLHLRYKKSGTNLGSRKALCKSFGSRYLDTITEIDFQAHCSNRRSGLNGQNKAKTFHDHTLFHLLFSKLKHWKKKGIQGLSNLKLPEDNPTVGVPKGKAFKRRRMLSPDEFSLLIEHCDEDLKDLLIALLDTGIRLGDALALSPEHYNPTSDLIEWVQSKTGKENSLPPTNRVRRIILRAIAEKKKFLFNSVNLRKRFEVARDKAGIHNLHIGRDFRKTIYNFARSITKGPDIPRQIMGHTSNRTGDDHYHIEDRKEVRPVIKEVEKVFAI